MFPETTPKIHVEAGTEAFSLSGYDCLYQFVPLVHGATMSVGDYTYPGQCLSEIRTGMALKLFDHGSRQYFKIAQRCDIVRRSELSRGGTCEFYISVRSEGIYTDAIIETPDEGDIDYMQYEDGPELLNLHPGLTWEGASSVRNDPNRNWELDITYEYRVSDIGHIVRVGLATFECLKLTQIVHPYRGSPPVKLEPELINESYLTQDGRCVLVRRYNGPVWARWNEALWETCAGSPRLEVDGTEYRLWRDKIPASVFEMSSP